MDFQSQFTVGVENYANHGIASSNITNEHALWKQPNNADMQIFQTASENANQSII